MHPRFAPTYLSQSNQILRNGKTGEEIHRNERLPTGGRLNIRTQRTKLQSALLSQIPPGSLKLSARLIKTEDLGSEGVRLYFSDNTEVVADLVVGADGIRSVTFPPPLHIHDLNRY